MLIGVNISFEERQKAKPVTLAAWIMLRMLQNPNEEDREKLEFYLLDMKKYSNMDGDEFEAKFKRMEELARTVLQESFNDFKTDGQMLARRVLEAPQKAETKEEPPSLAPLARPPLGAIAVNIFANKFFEFKQDKSLSNPFEIRVSLSTFQDSLAHDGLVVLLQDQKGRSSHLARIVDHHSDGSDVIYGNIPGMSSLISAQAYVNVPPPNFVEFKCKEGETPAPEVITEELNFTPGLVVGQLLPKSGLVVQKIIVSDKEALFAAIKTGQIPYKFVCAQCKKMDAPLICTGCEGVRYCGEECAEEHWRNGHALICFVEKERIALVGNPIDPKNPYHRQLMEMFNAFEGRPLVEFLLAVHNNRELATNLPYWFANLFPARALNQEEIDELDWILVYCDKDVRKFLTLVFKNIFPTRNSEKFEDILVARAPQAFFRVGNYMGFIRSCTLGKKKIVKLFLNVMHSQMEAMADGMREAAKNGQWNIVMLLLRNGALLRDEYDNILALASEAAQEKVVELILKKFDLPPRMLSPAMSYACGKGNINIVKMLENRGVKPNSLNLLSAVINDRVELSSEDIRRAQGKAKSDEMMNLLRALPQKRQKSANEPLGFSLKPDIGAVTQVAGQVVLGKSYHYVRITGMSEAELVKLAQKYAEIKGLFDWKVRAPYAWDEIGPHVTISLTPGLKQGEDVQVVLKNLHHFTDGKSRWIAFHVELPEKFKCPYGCHLSIGQQRI